MAQSIRVRFDIVGDNSLDSIFNNLAEVPNDFSPVFRQLAQSFWDHEKTVFESEGPGWRPLTPSYEKWKEKHYGPMPILQRTGALMRSLTQEGADGGVFNVSPMVMELGTEIPYAIYHQTGSIKVVDHPPQRKEMTLPDELQTKWNRQIADWLRGEIDFAAE